jgi:hypothetical protein
MKAHRAVLPIAALFLLGCTDRPGSDADAGSEFLPDQIHGLPLVESESGDAAAGMIARLHQASVAPTESHIGVYATEGLRAVFYVSRFASVVEADSQLSLMSYRIADGTPGFGHFRSFDVGGTSVGQVFGNGQVHYFYTDDADLKWLAAPPPLARAAVAELMEVDVELIPPLVDEETTGEPVEVPQTFPSP